MRSVCQRFTRSRAEHSQRKSSQAHAGFMDADHTENFKGVRHQLCDITTSG